MMLRSARAKQFMPFAGVKGLQEAILDREEKSTRVERHDVSEDDLAELDLVMRKLKKGDIVSVDCYFKFHDVVKTGTVNVINKYSKYIVVDNERIFFEDMYSLKIIG